MAILIDGDRVRAALERANIRDAEGEPARPLITMIEDACDALASLRSRAYYKTAEAEWDDKQRAEAYAEQLRDIEKALASHGFQCKHANGEPRSIVNTIHAMTSDALMIAQTRVDEERARHRRSFATPRLAAMNLLRQAVGVLSAAEDDDLQASLRSVLHHFGKHDHR